MNIFKNLIQLLPQESSPKIKKQRGGGSVKSFAEIETMKVSGQIVGNVLQEISALVKPGLSTADLDIYAEKRIRELGAIPSFKGYYGFPASICSSINFEAVHGIPSHKKIIQSGDVLKVDLGACYKGYHGDSCITVPVGMVTPKASELIEVARMALFKGIEQVKAGNCLLDIAGAIEDYAQEKGYSVVEDFTGHGIGRNLHEEPQVFNFRTNQLPNVRLKAGMVLAIEPILNVGSKYTKTLQDRWTVVTLDNSLSAQFEHTVLVTDTGYEILTNPVEI